MKLPCHTRNPPAGNGCSPSTARPGIHALLVVALFFLPLSVPAESEGLDRLDEAMGLPLVAGGSLWQDSADRVADRLRWPMESRTSSLSSYRSYKETVVFGRTAYSMVLHAEEDRPVSLSFVFANKGDIEAMKAAVAKEHSDARRAEREAANVERNFKRFIEEDAKALAASLAELFGEPSRTRTGESAQTAERAERWDAGGLSFLLAAPRGEYVTLRILPTESLDESGVERVRRQDLRADLRARVERRENGDVVLTDLPMVDQGPKGYCVPATWERALRYMGIPADMYVLAMAGNTKAGGGTYTSDISYAVRQLVHRNGRQLRTEKIRIQPTVIAQSIDEGIPLMWTMSSLDEVNAAVKARAADRQSASDWSQWSKEVLDPARRSARQLRPDPQLGHLCMIIGYNRETGEIATSDSWGPDYAERWMTFEEAQAISFGEVTKIMP